MIQYNLPLKIVSYKELYGWTMDEIVECIGNKNNCTFPFKTFLITGTYCGVFRRQALDRGSAMLGINHILTGHNADDMAETVLMNCTPPLSQGSDFSVTRRHRPSRKMYRNHHIIRNITHKTLKTV